MLVACKESHRLVDSHSTRGYPCLNNVGRYPCTKLTSTGGIGGKLIVIGCLVAGSPASYTPHIWREVLVVQIGKCCWEVSGLKHSRR